MWSRENIPLAVMTAASAAILFFFAISEGAVSSPRQHDGCGWLEDTAVSPAWRRVELLPRDLWNPAFPPSPPSRPLDRVGCMRSTTTAIGRWCAETAVHLGLGGLNLTHLVVQFDRSI